MKGAVKGFLGKLRPRHSSRAESSNGPTSGEEVRHVTCLLTRQGANGVLVVAHHLHRQIAAAAYIFWHVIMNHGSYPLYTCISSYKLLMCFSCSLTLGIQ